MGPFLALLLINAVLFVAGALLAPKPKFQDATPQDPEGPRTKEGDVIPVLFGTCKVAPNCVSFSNTRAGEQTSKVRTGIFSSHTITTGYFYEALMQVVLCHGPVDEILDVIFQESKSLNSIVELTRYGVEDGGGGSVIYVPWTDTTVLTDPVMPSVSLGQVDGLEFTVDAPELFGGYQRGGGVSGKLHFFWGLFNQTQSITMDYEHAVGIVGFKSRYEGICHAVFGKRTFSTVERFNFGEYGNVPPVNFVIRRCPNNLGLDPDEVNIDGGANPAEMIYEVLTNEVWGLAVPTDQIDTATFVAAGQALAAEEFGLSMSLTSGQTGDQIIAEILRYIDGQVQQHPVTGLLELSLNRKDYVVVDLPVINETNASGAKLTRPTWAQLHNEVRVIWTRYENGIFKETTTPPIQDIAAQRNFGSVNAETVSYQAVTNGVVAVALGSRDLRRLATPLSQLRFIANRQAADFLVGRPFVYSWADHGITAHVFRVVSVDYGKYTDGRIAVEAVEDIFAMEEPLYATPVQDYDDVSSYDRPSQVHVIPTSSFDRTYGYLELDLLGGSGKVTNVQFQEQSGLAAPAAWHDNISEDGFITDVTLDAKHQSVIRWRVLGTLQDGTNGILTDGEVVFGPSAWPARPDITYSLDVSTGVVDAIIDVDSDATHVKVLGSTTHVPTLAEVQATGLIAVPGGTNRVTVAGVLTLGIDQRGYISAIAVDVDGNESELASVEAAGVSSIGPSLTVTATPGATPAADYSIAWSALTGVVTLSIDGGAYATPGASPIPVSRHATLDKVYSFRSVGVNGQTITNAVTIPSLEKDTVTPNLEVGLGTSTATQQSYVVYAANPAGGTVPVITVTPYECTMYIAGTPYTTAQVVASGTAITVDRPATTATLKAHMKFAAVISGGGMEEIDISVDHQLNIGPLLDVQGVPNGTTQYDVYWTATGTVTFATDGGAYATPGNNPLNYTRHPTLDRVCNLRCVKDGQTISNSVTIPSLETDTVTPDLTITTAGASDTQASYVVSATNPAGGSAPTITVTPHGGATFYVGATLYSTAQTIASGTQVDANRPISTTTTQHYLVFRASVSGGGAETIVIEILPQLNIGPILEVQATGSGTSQYLVYWSGTGTITRSIDTAGYVTPGASPETVNRHATLDIVYNYKCVKDGQTITNTVTIPSLEKDTVTPDLTVTPVGASGTASSYSATATNPAGGSAPTITVTPYGGATFEIGGTPYTTAQTIASGTQVDAIRPVSTTTTQHHLVFRASLSGAGAETIDIEILPQLNIGPILDVQADPISPTQYNVYWSGTGTITVAISGGAHGTPGASPILVNRHATNDIVYSFKCIRDGQTITNSVTIPSLEKDTVTPDLSLVGYNVTDPDYTNWFVTAANAAGGTAPTITVTPINCAFNIYSSGVVFVSGPHTTAQALTSGQLINVERQASTSAVQAQVLIRASISGGGLEEISRTIPYKINLGPTLEVNAEPGPTDYVIAWSGTGTITMDSDGSGSFVTPPSSGFSVTRTTSNQTRTFKAVKDGQTITLVVEIPSLSAVLLTGFTSVVVTPLTSPCDGGGTLDVDWTDTGFPSGTTYDVRIEITSGTYIGTVVTYVNQVSGSTHNAALCPGESGTVMVKAHYGGVLIATGIQTFVS